MAILVLLTEDHVYLLHAKFCLLKVMFTSMAILVQLTEGHVYLLPTSSASMAPAYRRSCLFTQCKVVC